MPRITVTSQDVQGGSIRLREAAAIHHLVHVLRIRPGDAVECIDGTGRRYDTRLSRRSNHELLFDILRMSEEPAAGLSLWLVHALIRPERFDWLVQKATELGVARLSPVVTDRAIVRIPADGAAGKVARWQRIAREAAQQCGRASLPQIDPPAAFADVLRRLPETGLILLPTLAAQTEPLRNALNRSIPSSVVLCIGPEGDFTADEVAMARRHGALPVSLGRRILRSETAAVAVAAILQHAAGEL